MAYTPYPEEAFAVAAHMREAEYMQEVFPWAGRTQAQQAAVLAAARIRAGRTQAQQAAVLAAARIRAGRTQAQQAAALAAARIRAGRTQAQQAAALAADHIRAGLLRVAAVRRMSYRIVRLHRVLLRMWNNTFIITPVQKC